MATTLRQFLVCVHLTFISILTPICVNGFSPAHLHGQRSQLHQTQMTSSQVFNGVTPRASPTHQSQSRIKAPLAVEIAQAKGTATKSFDSFDYRHHWYPVSWLVDLPLNKPIKVTLFDTDYVVGKIPATETSEGSSRADAPFGVDGLYDIIAMEDRCPHKSAALSEGRITSSGHFQCQYHGWVFNGKNGDCIEIPQVIAAADNVQAGTSNSKTSQRMRTCSNVVPAFVQQGMVWLFPFGSLEEALKAAAPPRVPEMDMDGFKATPVVRDFPVDYSVLLENIMDPDHGVFVHSTAGFDFYSATRKHKQELEESYPNDGLGGKGWVVTSRVAAVEKLLRWNKQFRMDKTKEHERVAAKHQQKQGEVLVATTTFHAPSLVTIGRRNPMDSNSTKFLTCFWISPVGTGRSRFMSAAVGKFPLSPPRWFFHMGLNNFLDQDTHLLATQQVHVLGREAELTKKMMATKDVASENPAIGLTSVRKSLYVYASPTERLSARLGYFWDATLSRAPNRITTLLEQYHIGALRRIPKRKQVLDRWEQHTKVCPQSMDVVANCQKLHVGGFVSIMMLAVTKLLAMAASLRTLGNLHPQLLRFALWFNTMLKPAPLLVALLLSTMVSFFAKKLEREFYFKYDETFRDRDLEGIPKVWADQ